mmetsp:Transcript_13811/g.14365  ORF Transcript_13811/g.14365 Transcript_13811/m.14365 type:complete len:739 (-) Transcript_13811:58-2274(-)
MKLRLSSSLTQTLYFLTLLSAISCVFHDILSADRKENFLSSKEVKGMLSRVIDDYTTDISVDYSKFKKNHTPQTYIKQYLADIEQKKQINNSIRLLCNSGNYINLFDLFIFHEQSLNLQDQDIIKVTFYKFREIYLIWLLSKSIEKMHSKEEVSIPYICDWLNKDPPSSFFIDNESKMRNIYIQEIFNDEFIENLDVASENRTLSPFGFKLIINEKKSEDSQKEEEPSEGSTPNPLYKTLQEDVHFIGNQQMEIDVIRTHSHFNYSFSHLNLLLRPKLSINNKDQTNLKYLYTEMLTASIIYENLQRISLANLKNSFFNTFAVHMIVDNVFADVAKQVKQDKEMNMFTDKKITELVKMELSGSFSDLFNKGRKTGEVMYKQVRRLARLFFGQSISKDITSSGFYAKVEKGLSNMYDLNLLVRHCGFETLVFNDDFKDITNTEDQRYILRDFAMLCYYNKAISSLRGSIEEAVKSGDTKHLYVSVKDFFIESSEFSSLLVASQVFTEFRFSTIEKLLPSFTNNNYSSYASCIKLTKQEAFMLTASLYDKIHSNIKTYYVLFEVITSSYNTYLENSKFYLKEFMVRSLKDFKTLHYVLNKCPASEGKSFLEKASEKYYGKYSEGEENQEQDNKSSEAARIELLKLRLNNMYKLAMLVEHALAYEDSEFSDKMTKVRSLFYSFYYNDEAKEVRETDFDSRVVVYADYTLNMKFSKWMEDMFLDLFRLVFDVVPQKENKADL